MPWAKLDDNYPDHPKIIAAGPIAAWLNTCGICYCSRYLTDGFIPDGQVRKLADIGNPSECAGRLVDVGLWEKVAGGYLVHGFYKVCREDDRLPWDEWESIRLQVFSRDNYTCQYCGAEDVGMECDHIIPRSRGGSDDLTNLNTACRKCNRSKSDKTPDEWLSGKRRGEVI